MDKDQAIKEYFSYETSLRHVDFISSIQEFDVSAISVMVRFYIESTDEFIVADMVNKNDASLFNMDGQIYSFAGEAMGSFFFRKGMEKKLVELDLNKKIRKIF